MAIKNRNSKIVEVEQLANEMADKPYGEISNKDDRIVRTSFSMPASLYETLEDMAIKNKRAQRDLRTVSAIVREALDSYLANTLA